MGRMGNFSAADLRRLQRQLSRIQDGDTQAFLEACAKELAARLLTEVIKLTPVGKYPKSTGKKGGTLRRGWTSVNQEEAAAGNWRADSAAKSNAAAYVDRLRVEHTGNVFKIELVNPVEYASYVEHGHRTVSGGWATGRFMLMISEQELQEIAPKVLERKIEKFLKECMS